MLIIIPVVVGLTLVSIFVPARQVSIEGIGTLSFETTITLSVGSETAYASPGWLGTWDKRVQITIDHNSIDSDLTDFPLLLYLSNSSGTEPDDLAFVFTEIQNDNNRQKIAVTESDGTTQCYVEIERWENAQDEAWLWVKVPSISSSVDTVLYLYYDSTQPDNTTYVADWGSRPEVWSNGFVGVWHLCDPLTGGPPRMALDSTANNHDGTCQGGMNPGDQVDGQINGSLDLDGTNDRIQTTCDESETADDITWECWFETDTTTGAHHLMWEGEGSLNGWGEPADPTTHEMHLSIGRFDADDRLIFFYGFEGSGGNWAPAVEINIAFSDTSGFNYVAGVLSDADSSPAGEMYLNGSSVGTDTGTQTDRSYWDTDLRLGRPGASTRYYNGILDEVRVSDTDRDEDWIEATYETAQDNLLDYGSEVVYALDIVNLPASKDFGTVVENSSYWSNDSAPTFPLDDSECYFTVTNDSSESVDISIRATDFTGGTGWTLAASPGAGIVTLKAGQSGDALETNMVTLTTSDQAFISALAMTENKKWELKLETGTFPDLTQKTATITLTATFA